MQESLRALLAGIIDYAGMFPPAKLPLDVAVKNYDAYKKGEHAWMQPNGDGDRLRNHELLRDLDLPPLGGDGRGGPVVTRTLLISALNAGGSDGGPRLVARDKATGEILGSVDLPARAIGTPMTYMYEGMQYIALTIAGQVPELIALKLPS